jgi:predicted alpha/beta superfamily hydrolase
MARSLRTLSVAAAILSTSIAHALPVKKRGTTIYYHTEQSTQPNVLVEVNGTWAQRLRKMRPVRNRPGWWKSHVRDGASQLVFQHADSGEWIHPRDQQNFLNQHGAPEVYVKDRALTYAPPERAKVEQVVAPHTGGTPHPLTVILPPGYDPMAKKTYPVIYFFDGHNLLHSEFDPEGWGAHDALTQVVLGGKMEPAIIVGIHAPNTHEQRLDELSPYYVPKAKAGGQASAFLNYIGNELIPFIDSRYRTRAGADSHAVAGSSVGGETAMHALITRPDLFRRGLVYSPAVWMGNEQIVKDVEGASTLSGARIVLYQGSRGEHDGHDEGERTEKLFLALQKKQGLSLSRHVNENGLHREKYWRDDFPWGLSELFPAP